MPRLLLFVPHPDDESYAFGGLLATAADAGWRVLIHCASSGEGGKRHDGGSVDRLAAAREAELRESCRLLGADEPAFWRLPDGRLALYERELIERCEEAVRVLEPNVVGTLGPDGVYGHPDHIALHRAVEVVFATGGERSLLMFPVFPAGLFVPQYEKCIEMMGDPPNPPRSAIGGQRWHWELPTGRVRERKLGAMAAHRSQLPGGNPRAMFPEGIVEAVLEVERYAFARTPSQEELALLEALGGEFALRSR